jgi:hypothetical protein
VFPNPGEILAGISNYERGLFRSVDDGATWTPYDNVIDPGGPEKLLITSSGDAFLAHAADGIYKRSESDTAWIRSSSGMKSCSVYDFETLSDGTILAGCNNGLFRSLNNGVDWSKSHQGITMNSVDDLLAVSANEIYALVWSAGLFKSADRGQTWVKSGSGISATNLTCILESPTGDLYVGSQYMGVFFSSDQGTSWEERKSGLPAELITDLANAEGDVIIASTYDRVYRSTNHGVSWLPSDTDLNGIGVSCLKTHGAVTWAGTNQGIYTSDDQGQHWDKLPNTPFPAIGVYGFLFDGDSVIYCATGYGVFRSADEGATWAAWNQDLNSIIANCLGMTSESGLLAGSSKSSVFRLSSSSAGPEVTIRTSPDGRTYTVDGTEYSSTQSFNWALGSVHEIATEMTQSGPTGVRYIWTGWSDGGGLSHNFTTQPGAQTITVNFRAEYQLLMITDGAGTVTPQTGWYNPGASVSIRATPGAGQTFLNWEGSGTGSYTGTDNPASVTMSGAISQTAKFSGTSTTREITLQTVPPGRRITVDGQQYSNMHTFTWPVGSSHEISTTSPQQGSPGLRYVWNSWSNGALMAFTYVVDAGPTLELNANFDMQYSLTMTAGTGGTVSPGTSWHAPGAQVQISAAPQAGYEFERWEGSGPNAYTGTNNPATITLANALTENAFFRQVSDIEVDPSIPLSIRLHQNAPNPCASLTTFSFALPNARTVSLVITDLLGRERVRILDNRVLSAGEHRFVFDAAPLRPGVYIYRLESNGEMRFGRMIVIR